MKLKIKDDVDLKELEKFDFKGTIEDDGYYYTNQNSEYITYWINSYTRIIEIEVSDEIVILNNIIYDLIQAGLVEKVEG